MEPIVIKKALAPILLSFAIASAYAIPAKPGLISMRQSDGTEVSVRLVGDEHAHSTLRPTVIRSYMHPGHSIMLLLMAKN